MTDFEPFQLAFIGFEAAVQLVGELDADQVKVTEFVGNVIEVGFAVNVTTGTETTQAAGALAEAEALAEVPDEFEAETV